MTQPTPTCTEHELVDAVRAGSDRAFEELYSRYRLRISSYIAGMVGDHARAEDIAQEVFISALRRLRQTDRPVMFKPWIYEIAKNACIDDFRRTKRAREVPLEHDDDSDSGPRWISTAATPDVEIEHKQSLRDLQGAFHGLSDSHHKVMVMREFEGLSYDQIGERMGMSKAMVESTLFRARRRLSEEYGELVSGRRCQQVQSLIAEREPSSLLKLGVRQRRQLARHLSHCQPCRLEARMAGVDDSLFQAPSIAGKIAALLPTIPWLRWRRGAGQRSGVAGSDGHTFSLLQPLQTVARLGDMVGSSAGLGRALTAAAALAAAGLGTGVVSAVASHGHSPVALRAGMPMSAAGIASGSQASTSRHSSTSVSSEHRGNSKLWAPGNSRSTAVPGPTGPAAGGGPKQGNGGTGSGSTTGRRSSSRYGGSASSTSHSTLLNLPVIGGGSSSKRLLGSLPKLGKPGLPKLALPKLPTPPAQIQLPKLGGSGSKPSIPLPKLPNPTKLP